MAGFIATLNIDSPAIFESGSAAQSHRGQPQRWQGSDTTIISFLSSQKAREHFVSESKGLSLVVSFDGCIDNAADLRRELKLAADAADAELVARAYQRWKCDSFQRLLGIFSFVIWDEERKSLICVRDVVGTKPLHFYYDQVTGHFVCASEIAGVLASDKVPREINEIHLAERILSAASSAEATPYQQIHKLPPAHYLEVSEDGMKIRRYFAFDLHSEIRFTNDEGYIEEFARLFEKVITSQLPSEGGYAIELSGGLDSSCVTGITGKLISQAGIPGPLKTLSQVYPGRKCDERTYMEDVARMWQAESHFVAPFDHLIFEFVDQIKRHADLPIAAQYAPVVATHTKARELGVHTILTGFGSDELFSGSREHWRDVLRSGRLGELSESRSAYGKSESRLLLRSLLKNLFGSFVPSTVRRRRYLRALASRADYFTEELVNQVKATDGQERNGTFANHAQQDIVSTLYSPWCTNVLEMQERMATSFGLKLRHPFLDRRIIQFALSIPESLRWRGDTPKFVVQEACRSVLPPSVLKRRDKTEFPEIQFEAIMKGFGEVTAAPRLTERGWIDAKQLAATYARVRELHSQNDDRYGDLVWPLWCVFAAESFLANQ